MRTVMLCGLALVVGSTSAPAQMPAFPAPNPASGLPAYPGLPTGPQYPALGASSNFPTYTTYPYQGPPNASYGAPTSGTLSGMLGRSLPPADSAKQTRPGATQAQHETVPDADKSTEACPAADACPSPGEPRVLMLPMDKSDDMQRIRVSVDYLQTFMRGAPLPVPLLTTTNVPNAFTANVGDPGTSVLAGDDRLSISRPGIQGAFGFWLDAQRTVSLDLGAFYMAPWHNTMTFASDANGNPVLARPAVDARNGMEISFLNSVPGLSTATTTIDDRTTFWGGDLSARWHTPYGNKHFESLIGYRFLRLSEALDIRDDITTLQGGFFTFLGNTLPAGTLLSDRDFFRTTNEFHGGELGGRLRWDLSSIFFIDAFGKVSVGVNNERVIIDGATSVTSGGTTQSAPGGILAQQTNIGTYRRQSFAYIPEAGISAGVDLWNHLRLKAGYSFLFWNSVVRPGNQIDRAVNPFAIPSDQSFGLGTGPARPTFDFHGEPLWVHFVTAGLEFHY